MTTILDPTNESIPVERSLAKRNGLISGRLALLDISKPRGNILLKKFENMLASQFPDIVITHYAKPTFAKPAPEALRTEIRDNNDFLIEALAD
ncbi:MAG: hypothetical protein KUG75_07305 [Pseudomonadales bacterium]|nr:hypothetical protein [Pseudomonadales bacterium]